MSKYFGTDGVRSEFGVKPMTIDFIMKLANAYTQMLIASHNLPIYLAHDSRQSSRIIIDSLTVGLNAAGMDVINLGLLPTPVLAYITYINDAYGAIMVSASHNPYHDNGLKLFTNKGEKLTNNQQDHLEYLIDNAALLNVKSDQIGRVTMNDNLSYQYVKYVKHHFLSKIKYNKKIVIDCANGATSIIIKTVLSGFNLDVIYICDKPNGVNINDKCGATSMQLLQEKVILEQASVGIAFDGDGDRIIMVDEKGNIIDGDAIVYILSKFPDVIGKSKGYAGTLMTNIAYENAFAKADVKFL